MPVPFLKNLSKETGKSVDELEKLWGKAKKLASEHFDKPESEFGDTEFAYVVGIVKKMAGKEENIEILTVTEDIKIPGTNFMIKKGQQFEFSKKEVEESVELNEKTDWTRIEQALLKNGLKFNKYGISFNARNFELTRMYLSSEYTVLTFYNEKGFKSMFNGMEFPLLIVAEYAYAVEDINKERPDDITIFDDIDDGYSYASHLDSDAEEYSMRKNSRDFWLTHKELCEEVEMKHIEIKEECRIPGTDIILEAGDKIKIIKESHIQGICPVCGENIWSDEGVFLNKDGKWCHDHCLGDYDNETGKFVFNNSKDRDVALKYLLKYRPKYELEKEIDFINIGSEPRLIEGRISIIYINKESNSNSSFYHNVTFSLDNLKDKNFCKTCVITEINKENRSIKTLDDVFIIEAYISFKENNKTTYFTIFKYNEYVGIENDKWVKPKFNMNNIHGWEGTEALDTYFITDVGGILKLYMYKIGNIVKVNTDAYERDFNKWTDTGYFNYKDALKNYKKNQGWTCIYAAPRFKEYPVEKGR